MQVDVSVQVVGTGLSDHLAQVVCFSHASEYVSDRYTGRNFSPKSLSLLNELLGQESWDAIKNHMPVDDQFKAFVNIFNYHLSAACPIKVSKYKKLTHKGWLTKGIIKSSKTLKQLHHSLKLNNCKENRDHYKRYKKIYYKVIRVAKADNISQFLTQSSNRSRDAWKIINNHRKGAKSNNDLTIHNDEKDIVEGNKACEVLNCHFSTIGKNLSKKRIPPHFIKPNSPVTCKINYPFLLNPVTTNEVSTAIGTLKNKSTIDALGISNTVLKTCKNSLCKPLAYIINSSFQQGVFPTLLKTSSVAPLFKGGDSHMPESYRPITIISGFSKFFESVFLNRMIPLV